MKLVEIGRLRVEALDEIVGVHCDAFYDYPAMRFVLGRPSDYDQRLVELIGLFLAGTLWRGGVAFGIRGEDGELLAAADVLPPSAPASERLETRRETVWERLGADARSRYEAYSRATESFEPAAPHCYLSMLGVRRRAAGSGLARPLLEAVQAFSAAYPHSTGVALETETASNIGFYEHFGYELVGHVQVSDDFESWGLFRPDNLVTSSR